ncbi:MAG TPA: phosphate acyltransferase [Bacteroidales bacterium]|nr:phosphate acyltransferase [Bacteroidales bacterium]HRT80696.1 phosphate acyltransferase [Bacteroidales bacterium]
MKIGLDAMGGDFAPEVTVQGAILSLDILSEKDRLVLFGKKDLLENLFKQKGYLRLPKTFEIVNCNEIISMDDDPVKSFMEKAESSIVMGFGYLKKGLIDSFASAGNTGAMLVGAVKVIETIPGIDRPCISSFVPNDKGQNNLLADVGINADPKPENLLEYAILASVFAKNVMNIPEPKVGLMNIGKESSKGNILAKTTYHILENSSRINFIGNIEGGDIFKADKVDVIITDGFTGNVVLKLVESFYNLIKLRNITDNYFDNFNYENYGGTPILGVNKPVIVGHGKSSALALKNMIHLSYRIVESEIINKLKKEFKND